MAEIPIYLPQDRAPRAMPLPERSADSFGAPIARGIEQLGAGAEDLGKVLDEKHDQEQSAAAAAAFAKFTADQTVSRIQAQADGTFDSKAAMDSHDQAASDLAGQFTDPKVSRWLSGRLAEGRGDFEVQAATYDAKVTGAKQADDAETMDDAFATSQVTHPDVAGLQLGLKTAADMWDSRALPETVKLKGKRESAEKYVGAYVDGMRQSGQAVTVKQQLASGMFDAYLDGPHRGKLGDEVDSQIRSDEARARAGRDLVKAAVNQRLDLGQHRIAAGELLSDGELTQLASDAKAIGEPVKAFDLDTARKRIALNRETQSWTAQQYDDEINRLAAKVGPGGTVADPYAEFPLVTNPDKSTWDKRGDGTEKGMGFLGLRQRPDGKVSSEISVGLDVNGKEMDVPSMVPGLTKQEMTWLMNAPVEGPNSIAHSKDPIAVSILQKAAAHASERVAARLSPFKQPGEGDYQPPSASSDDEIRLSQLRAIAPARKAAFTGDPGGWAASNGHPPPAIDPNSGDGFAERSQWRQGVQASTGQWTPTLSKAEAAPYIEAASPSSPPAEKLKTAIWINQWGGEARNVLRQVAPDSNGAFAQAVELGNSSSANMRDAINGAAIKPDAGMFKPDPEDPTTTVLTNRAGKPVLNASGNPHPLSANEIIERTVGPALMGRGTTYAAALSENAMNIYAATAQRSGWTTKLHGGELQVAVNRALGGVRGANGEWTGGLGASNGAPMVLPIGVTQRQFDAATARALPSDYSRAGGGGVPSWHDRPATDREIQAAVRVSVGGGRYALRIGNGFLNNGRNRPFTFDYRRLVGQ